MKIAITGACGLLGQAVVAQATARGHQVIAIDRDPAVSDVPAHSHHQVDICETEQLTLALSDVAAVVHAASLIDLHLGQPERLHRVNVEGVKSVITACRTSGVPALVHMSSAEVIAGHEPLRGATEAQPYPEEPLTYYGLTKQWGEEAVLAAADSRLGTCAMRSFGIFGEGDNTVVPSYLSRLVGNRVAQVGDGEGRTDTVYAPNLAHALLLAAEQLTPQVVWSGTPFHVTDSEPVAMQQFLRELTDPLDVRFMTKLRVPRSIAKATADFYELRYRLMSTERFAYPRLTSHSSKLAFDDYWLDSSKVRRMLGYEPVVERADAIKRTQQWVRETYA